MAAFAPGSNEVKASENTVTSTHFPLVKLFTFFLQNMLIQRQKDVFLAVLIIENERSYR